MGFELIALLIGIIIGAAVVYFLGRTTNRNKKRHWSEGYMVIGRDSPIKKEEVKQQETGSMFPPGW